MNKIRDMRRRLSKAISESKLPHAIKTPLATAILDSEAKKEIRDVVKPIVQRMIDGENNAKAFSERHPSLAHFFSMESANQYENKRMAFYTSIQLMLETTKEDALVKFLSETITSQAMFDVMVTFFAQLPHLLVSWGFLDYEKTPEENVIHDYDKPQVVFYVASELADRLSRVAGAPSFDELKPKAWLLAKTFED